MDTDTLEKYIKMCQEAWTYIKREVRIDDLIMVVGDSDPARCVGIHEVPADQFGEVAKYQYLSPFQKCLIHGKNMLTTNNRVYYGYVGHTFVVWTQDQLQEMAWDKEYDESNVMHLLLRFKSRTHSVPDALPPKIYNYQYWTQFDTFEQLWLAFVMYEKYGRVWDNKKVTWVKLP